MNPSFTELNFVGFQMIAGAYLQVGKIGHLGAQGVFASNRRSLSSFKTCGYAAF